MDIKGVVRNILPIRATATKRSQEVTSRTESTGDRDGNGQQATGGDQGHRGMTEEEIQQAMQALEALPGVKENGLTIRLSRTDGVPVVFIEDRLGKVVRRIPEAELSLLRSRTGEIKTGHILNKAM